ncbi:MAG: hypothetical protein JWP49_1378 [Phenylobacterium sp.]|jgi:hypothetical protein|nr:hypothetical protein [Phenylobacterium sp.]
MRQTDAERARDTARSLVDVLTAYEEELMVLERETPGVAPLRRAVGMAIAEACYLVSDRIAQPEPGWAPPPRGWAD